MTDTGTSDIPKPFLRRLLLMNYKSIASCSVPLSQFTVFVGPNGAGKSNLLDALRFVTDSLRNSLEYALRDRGGIKEVRRRSKGHPRNFGVRLEMRLPDGREAVYAFRIGALPNSGFTVKREICRIAAADRDRSPTYFEVSEGKLLKGSLSLPPIIEPDRLYLRLVSGLSQFRPLYDSLSRMGFYNLSPDRIRDLQDPDPAEILARDGGNIASILGRMKTQHGPLRERIEQYLAIVVPGIRGVDVKHLGPKETIEFKQDVPGDDNPWNFMAMNMSDGTLRVLGVLAAIFQRGQVPLVGIEEPESALHPAASSALASAFLEAAESVQILITSHSPDLLDHEDIRPESILAVVSREGKTLVGPVDEGSRRVLREGLYTPGELLRLAQIQPHASLFAERDHQLKLFDA